MANGDVKNPQPNTPGWNPTALLNVAGSMLPPSMKGLVNTANQLTGGQNQMLSQAAAATRTGNPLAAFMGGGGRPAPTGTAPLAPFASAHP